MQYMTENWDPYLSPLYHLSLIGGLGLVKMAQYSINLNGTIIKCIVLYCIRARLEG